MKRSERKKIKKVNWPLRVDIFKILSILLIILFIYLSPLFVKKLIYISKVECVSQYGTCSDDLNETLKFSQGHDLYASKSNIDRILKENIQINSYLIQYKIPNILKVEVNIKKPRYAIKDLKGTTYAIDKEGSVLGSSVGSSVPTLVKNEVNYKMGDKISTSDLFALEIIEKTAILYPVSTGLLDKETLKITLENNILVLYPTEGDVDVLIGSLRLIFSRLNEGSQGIRMEDVREIDLRFKNAVLR